MERCWCGNVFHAPIEQERHFCLECCMANGYFQHPLQVPVPPMLEVACGYHEDAQYLALHWGGGDEAYVADGRMMFTGEWDGYLLFTQHPLVYPFLHGVNLGSSDELASHWLVLNRKTRELFLLEVKLAEQLLQRQWPRAEPLTPEQVREQEKQLLLIQERWINHKPTLDGIFAAMYAHQKVVQEMSAWLNDVLIQAQTVQTRKECPV